MRNEWPTLIEESGLFLWRDGTVTEGGNVRLGGKSFRIGTVDDCIHKLILRAEAAETLPTSDTH